MISEILVAVFTLVLFLKLLGNFSKRKLNLPPGPPRWPIIGNVIELALADPKYPSRAFDKLAKKYGEIMSVGLGVHPAVVISSFPAMKQILTTDCMTSRYSFPFMQDRSFNKGIGIIFGNGTNWKEIRMYTLKTLREFGFGKKGSLESVLQEEVQDMIALVKNKASKNGGIYDVDSHEIGASAVNILWNMVAGYRFPVGDETFKEFVKLDEKQMEIMSHNNVYNPFPFLRHWFPKWTNYVRHLEIHKEIQDFMRDVVQNMKNKRDTRENPAPQNFIEIFLDRIKKEAQSGNNQNVFTDEQLIVVLMDLFIAGSETTGTGFVWSLLYLVLNPSVQKRAQEEISQVVLPDEEISLSHLSKMPYVQAVIFEIFRISNFVPMPPPRIALEDFQYKNYTIPKGTCIMWNMHCVKMDEEFWKDPQVFRPERFLDESGTRLVSSKTERVATFGFGKRICLGEGLGKDIIFMYMTNFLRSFTLEIVPGKEPSPDNPISGMTVAARPFCVKVHNRR